MDEFNIDYGHWRDSKPHGHRVQDFIMTYPEWAIYLRRDMRFKCPNHWDQASESPKSFNTPESVSCQCWGFGVLVSGSIVPSKVSRGRNAELGSSPGEIKDMPGYLDYFRDVIHFPRQVLPQINDLVIFCEWNTKTQKIDKFPPTARPIRVHSVYIIRQVNSYFHRELSHLSCGVESHNIQADLINSLISTRFANLPVLNPDTTWTPYWTT